MPLQGTWPWVRGEELFTSHQACHRSCQAFPPAWERKHLHKQCYNSTWQEAEERSVTWLGETSSFLPESTSGGHQEKAAL